MDWKHILPDLCRGRIESRFVPAESGLPVGASRFGGQPDVPAGFTWPVFETAVPEDETVKPRPLAFLAQFDCASLAPLDREGLLPKTGLLSFFYELGSQRWGYDPKDAGCARVYWFDGAPLAPAGFPVDLPEDFRLPELAAELSGNPLTDGLTLSGGEPFCQAAECAALARIARERGLNVWAYTGYTYKRLLAGEVPDALALLEQVDVLVDGPFVEAEKSYAALFRGSANQRLIDVPKSLAAGAVVLWERPDPLAHFTRPES